MRRGRITIAAVAAAAALVLAACGDDSGGGSSAEPLAELGAGEGELNLIAWAGYTEDASGCVYGARYGRASSLLASASPTISPLA